MKCKALKQKPLIKAFGPINKHVVKKMKAWDDIVKSIKHSNDGPNYEESNPHDDQSLMIN